MREPVYSEKIEYFLLDFMNSTTRKSGVVPRDFYKYIYLFNEDNYYVLITSIFYNEPKAFRVLEYIISQDPVDVLVAIDNVIFGETVIFPNLSLIKAMDSQEEKIHNMMMKNKELEVRRRQKEMKYKRGSGSSSVGSNLVKGSSNVVNTPSTNPTSTTINPTPSVTKKKHFETSGSPVFICLKERLRCSLDYENNLKSVEVLGEMTLNIKDESLKGLEIHLEGDYKDCKFSPKLSKDSSTLGVIRSDKPFSLNKNIALLKWKDLNLKRLPIEFTFWPSEVKLNTYQISLEFTTDRPLENLNITIPKGKLRDIQSEDLKDKGNVLEWNVHSSSTSLEFQCRCEDPTDIFPIEVYFTSNVSYRDIEVGEVLCDGKPLDCVDVKRVLEVDSFTLESE